MSRSYKKTFAVSDSIKGGKRLANKKVRRTLKKDPDSYPSSKSHYKKIMNPWEVRDYREVAPSFEIFCERQLDKWRHLNWHILVYTKGRVSCEPKPTKKELWERYQRWYKRK